jgi:16S rRNA (guanine527-N7)-methyltransferase
MDMGSGCGFPGAVVTAAFPHWEYTFMDSVGKKMKLLEECALYAGWNRSFLVCRAEELAREPQSRESWNGITARAVADFRVVLEYAMPLLTIGGHLVNWMTDEQLSILDESQKALSELKAKTLKKASYQLPHIQNLRWIVIVEKMGTTPIIYPRPVGKALKKPIQ